MSALLSVKNLSKEFGGVHAVEDLSFEVEKGRI
ncbi:MAG TPA: high-affinity branched-chain amino acid ABC transporter ATP-binding protein LivG, partial [Alcanivorax sp.]|nr:high-affinity branched-chain amino acid ABC transporter ATP-binding protein LivG [Alcanivorax sp.]